MKARQLSRLLRRLEEDIEVDSETGCHVWTGAWDSDGYAIVRSGRLQVRVRRLVMQAELGRRLRRAEHVYSRRELCINPACVLVGHLLVGTLAEIRRAYMTESIDEWRSHYQRSQQRRSEECSPTLTATTCSPASP